MVAEGLDIPLTEVYGVASFYAQFTLNPKGKYQISLCLGTACYVKGASDILEAVQQRLGIKPGSIAGRKVLSGRLPLYRRLRPGPCYDDQQRCVRPPYGGSGGEYSG